MKFAHFADVHLGSWKDLRLSDAGTKAFVKAVDVCFQSEVDFILISGDFFNTSLPSVDCLKEAAAKLREIKERGIAVYAIAGSHDFSPTGKTMLDVFESAGLLTNVMIGSGEDKGLKLKFTVDEKTGAKITGVVGRKGMLERKYFKDLARESLEGESGFRIFMFHTAVSEFKPEGLEKMDSVPLSEFPRGFDYYAGGHVHEPYKREQPGYGFMANPGPLFPNTFREIEKLGSGGFYLVEKNANGLNVSFKRVQLHEVVRINVDCRGKSPGGVESALMGRVSGTEFGNAIVTVRLHGKLGAGKPSAINLKPAFDAIYEKGAYFVMRNSAKLTGSGFKEIKIGPESVEEAEDSIIKEHLSKVKVEGLGPDAEFRLVKELMLALNTRKREGETNAIFERRLKDSTGKILNAPA